jgi:TPR repeat protein
MQFLCGLSLYLENSSEATRWFIRSAEHWYAPAQAFAALAYLHGNGIKSIVSG